MAHILIRNKVEDFEKWKPVFDEYNSVRQAYGQRQYHLFRDANDPNQVIILLEWDTIDNAQRFAQSDDLREAMKRAGVADRPDIYFLNEV